MATKVKYKLDTGAHDVLDVDPKYGNVCINELAVLARGFEYRRVMGVDEIPPCFSQVISMTALEINDNIHDDSLRDELLLPFVVKLAGTYDPKTEKKRKNHLVKRLSELMYDNYLNASFDFDVAEFGFSIACKNRQRSFKEHIARCSYTELVCEFLETEIPNKEKIAVKILGEMIKMGKHESVATWANVRKGLAEIKKAQEE